MNEMKNSSIIMDVLTKNNKLFVLYHQMLLNISVIISEVIENYNNLRLPEVKFKNVSGEYEDRNV